MSEPPASERIDKWLWHARIVKTRTLAAKLAASGQVRINRRRITRPSQQVHIGDVLTLARRGGVRVLKVAAIAERRGPAEEAGKLYELISELPRLPAGAAAGASSGRAGIASKSVVVAARPAGAGRPTKRDRRAIVAFLKGAKDGGKGH